MKKKGHMGPTQKKKRDKTKGKKAVRERERRVAES